LALFAAAWEARQAAAEAPPKTDRPDDQDPGAQTGGGEAFPPQKNGGRQPLAKHLKRERIVHDLAEADKHCATCQQDLRPMGEESSERYEFIPAQLIVIEDVGYDREPEWVLAPASKVQPFRKSKAKAMATSATERFCPICTVDPEKPVVATMVVVTKCKSASGLSRKRN
jgi:hypothetical protein